MNVLLLTNDFFPSKGGVGIHVTKLAEYLCKYGVCVTVAVGYTFEEKDSSYMWKENYKDIEVIKFKIGRSVNIDGNKKFLYDVNQDYAILEYQTEFASKVIDYVKNSNMTFDIIHGHHIICSMAYKFIADMIKKPLILTYHQFYSDKKSLKYLIGQYMAYSVDAAIGVSEEVTKMIQEYNTEAQVITIHNAIDRAVNGVEDIISEERKNILFCGRIESTKGWKECIEAFEQLKKKNIYNDLKLHIAGTGSEYKDLKEMVKLKRLSQHVYLHGFLEQDKLFELYRKTLIIILPSTREGFSTVALEAMRFGTCLVTSDIGSFKEMINHRETGIIVKQNECSEIVSAIECLINNNELRKKIITNAFQHVNNRYTWDLSIEKLIKIYKMYL